MRPSRFLATSPQPAGHSRHTVEKYAATPGTIPSGGTTYGMSFSGSRPISSLASCPQPAAATATPEVATILKKDRRSIPLIRLAPADSTSHGSPTAGRDRRCGTGARASGREQQAHRPSTLVRSSRGIARARREIPPRAIPQDIQSQKRASGAAGMRNNEAPSSRPCEPYHAKKQRSIAIWRSEAQRTCSKARRATRSASARSEAPWASPTKPASNCEAARNTPPSSMAWKKRP